MNSQMFNSWRNSKNKDLFWKEIFGRYYEDYEPNAFKCLNKSYEYLTTIENLNIDDCFIMPTIVRSIILIKTDNKKIDVDFYCKIIKNIIDHILNNLENKIAEHLPRKSDRFDPEAEACGDLSKDIVGIYYKLLRKEKLNRILNEKS